MFKLFELSIGFFAVIKSNEEQDKLPVTVYGFIGVEYDSIEGYYTVVDKDLISDELAQSGEMDGLKEMAIFLTAEVVDDEFGD